MYFDWNIYINSINEANIERVIAIRPSSKVRKERSKKDKDRNSRHFEGNNVSFNDCLLKIIDDNKDYEEDRPKRLLK